jgi:hypothetical protein
MITFVFNRILFSIVFTLNREILGKIAETEIEEPY